MNGGVQLWVYRARLVRVVDGDTIDVHCDAGFRSYRTERLRILGVNAPEAHAPTRVAGDVATAFVVAWLAPDPADPAWPLIVRTEKSDVFGRYLAQVVRARDGASLADALVVSGHAVADVR